jgi:hypothetical protein
LKRSIIFAKSSSEQLRRSTFVDDDEVDLSGLDVGKQPREAVVGGS